MNRGAAAVFFMLLGAFAASAVWWTLVRPEPPSEPSRADTPGSRSDQLDEAVDHISRMIAAQSEATPASRSSGPPVDDSRLADIQARLSGIEDALRRLEERRTAKPDLPKPAGAQEQPADPPPRIPAPKPKDQRLIDDLLAKGAREPGANGRTYFGLTPREIQQALGKPDNTKWDTAAGHHDWFYLDTAGATALQVPFEGGVVVGVWP